MQRVGARNKGNAFGRKSLWFIDWLLKLFQVFRGSIKAQQKPVVDHTALGVELETSDAALPEDEMFTQRQIYLEKAIFAAMAVLLFATAGQSALLTDNLQTTTTPALSDSSLTTQPDNSSVEGPRVLLLHRSCESEHDNYCGNGGKCMYPQDNDKPFCICTSSYSGPRCLFYNQASRSLPELEQLIGIGFGVVILIIVLAILIYCFAYKRCVKSAPLIKSVPSETSV